MDNAAAKRQRRIEAIRAITKPSPVRLHHEPRWLLKLARDRLRAMKRHIPSGSKLWMLCHTLGIDPHFMDHWGTTDNGETFVCEPYLSHRDLIAAIAFADMLRLDLDVSAVSEWNPPSTIRLSFTRKQETDRG